MKTDITNAKPILFNTEMVKAILDGRKSQFREVIDFCEVDDIYINENGKNVISVNDKILNTTTEEYVQSFINKNSKYKIGDILYVKEKCVDESPNGLCFKEDYEPEDWSDKNLIKRWCNNINARIFLKVTNVTIEKLNNFGLDPRKEGIRENGLYTFAVDSERERKRLFINLWNKTAPKGYKWEDNPYVFVYEFKRVEKAKIN